MTDKLPMPLNIYNFYIERFHKDPHVADMEKDANCRSSSRPMTSLSSVEARLVQLFQKDFLLLLGILK